MFVQTPEIRWHFGSNGKNDAILSLHFLPNPLFPMTQSPSPSSPPSTSTHVMASGGADKEVKLWLVQTPPVVDTPTEAPSTTGPPPEITFLHALRGHDRSINIVRFSPNAQTLASAGDDACIILWRKLCRDWTDVKLDSDVSRKLLSCGHQGDITDVTWSPRSTFVCSVSVDNRVQIWSAETGKIQYTLQEHQQYVQGVAWDPYNQFMVTQGNDRTCRVYNIAGLDDVLASSTPSVAKKIKSKKNKGCTCIAVLRDRLEQEPPSSDASTKGRPVQEKDTVAMTTTMTMENPSGHTNSSPFKHRLFIGDTFPSFFRRLSWTPDGTNLIIPSGIYQRSSDSPVMNTVYSFHRTNFASPMLHFPLSNDAGPSLAVRCSPIVYRLRDSAAGAVSSGHDNTGPTTEAVHNAFNLPYRLVFAVITLKSVFIYDSQQIYPIAQIRGIHYADLTDISWANDGNTLVVSSLDGYCSFVHLPQHELGQRLSLDEMKTFGLHSMLPSEFSDTPDDGMKENSIPPTLPKVNVLLSRKKSKPSLVVNEENPQAQSPPKSMSSTSLPPVVVVDSKVDTTSKETESLTSMTVDLT